MSPPGDRHGHQAPDGPGLLPRPAPSSRPAAARPAHPDQCPYPQGSAQGHQEVKETDLANHSAAKPKKKSKRVITAGIANFPASFHNPILTITDSPGTPLSRAHSGGAGLSGSRPP